MRCLFYLSLIPLLSGFQREAWTCWLPWTEGELTTHVRTHTLLFSVCLSDACYHTEHQYRLWAHCYGYWLLTPLPLSSSSLQGDAGPVGPPGSTGRPGLEVSQTKCCMHLLNSCCLMFEWCSYEMNDDVVTICQWIMTVCWVTLKRPLTFSGWCRSPRASGSTRSPRTPCEYMNFNLSPTVTSRIIATLIMMSKKINTE